MKPEPMALVVEPTDLNVAKAEKFGRITYVFADRNKHASPATSRFAVAVVDRARELGFDPAKDYVVITGNALTLVAAVAALTAHYGELQALYFDGHDNVRDYRMFIAGERFYSSLAQPPERPATSAGDGHVTRRGDRSCERT